MSLKEIKSNTFKQLKEINKIIQDLKLEIEAIKETQQSWTPDSTSESEPPTKEDTQAGNIPPHTTHTKQKQTGTSVFMAVLSGLSSVEKYASILTETHCARMGGYPGVPTLSEGEGMRGEDIVTERTGEGTAFGM
jgi:hypothetical protein